MTELPKNLHLGDLQIIGSPSLKLTKALAAVSLRLHACFAEQSWIAGPDKSKESCVLSSLTVRDFLFQSGFRDVEVRPVKLVITANRDGEELHTLGLGFPPKEPRPGRWSGHLVVAIPSEGYLIDTTIFSARRPVWDFLPGMIAAPLQPSDNRIFDLPVLSDLSAKNEDGSVVTLFWLDDQKNRSWKQAPDAKQRWRREGVVRDLLKTLNNTKNEQNG